MLNFSRGSDRPPDSHGSPERRQARAASRASTSRRAPSAPPHRRARRCRPIRRRCATAMPGVARPESAQPRPRSRPPNVAPRRRRRAESGSKLFVGVNIKLQGRGDLRLRSPRHRGACRGDRAQQGDADRAAGNPQRHGAHRRRGGPRRVHRRAHGPDAPRRAWNRQGVGNDSLRPPDRRRRRHDQRRHEADRCGGAARAPARPPAHEPRHGERESAAAPERASRRLPAMPAAQARPWPPATRAAQFALNVTRRTFLSYSASVAIVISVPSAANTRPPLPRQMLRSYWHGPISGCLRHRASTCGDVLDGRLDERASRPGDAYVDRAGGHDDRRNRRRRRVAAGGATASPEERARESAVA